MSTVSVCFIFDIWSAQEWNWCGKVDSGVNISALLPLCLSPSLSLFFPFLHFSLLQLCVQKLRILIEDSDQNCEPSVNACSVSFSHCLRVSDYGTVHPLDDNNVESLSLDNSNFMTLLLPVRWPAWNTVVLESHPCLSHRKITCGGLVAPFWNGRKLCCY